MFTKLVMDIIKDAVHNCLHVRTGKCKTGNVNQIYESDRIDKKSFYIKKSNEIPSKLV